ncbi:unnamed protein product [Microthlaspi erraticum]|uniref:Secreted protein n=1 Tax=Microthlaspi erraticum TaxID=1685480 RepID=A0A6D2L025_9BRAS|nr:unnamed protein product [Microthlaspi erraticum]
MLLPLPLSFFALLIFPFPSNGGQAAAGAGGKNLREDALRTFKSCLSLCSNKTHPPAGKNARQVLIRSRRAPERLGEGRGMRRGKENSEIERFFFLAEDGLRCVLSEGSTLFRPRCYDCRSLSSFRPLAYWDSSLRALPAH